MSDKDNNSFIHHLFSNKVVKATKIASVSLKQEYENIKVRGITDELAGIVERSRGKMKKMQRGKNQGSIADIMNLRPTQQRTIALMKVILDV